VHAFDLDRLVERIEVAEQAIRRAPADQQPRSDGSEQRLGYRVRLHRNLAHLRLGDTRRSSSTMGLYRRGV